MAVVLTYLDSAGVSGATPSVSLNLGAASAYDRILIGFATRGGASQTITGVTVDGNAATELVEARAIPGGSSTCAALYLSDFADGGTVTVAATVSPDGAARSGFIAWGVTDIGSDTPHDTAVHDNTHNSLAAIKALDIPAGGAAVCITANNNAASVTPTEIDQDASFTQVDTFTIRVFGGSKEYATTQTGLSIGGTHGGGTANLTVGAFASFEPAASAVDLLADDVESDSEVTAPALGVIHNLSANDVESASETSAPSLGTIHNLNATDAESASEVSAPVIAQIHVLTATDVESASEVTAPSLAEVVPILAEDVESTSEVSVPVIGQIHVLNATDAESASETSEPSLGQVHALTATSVESASEVSEPTAAQANVLFAEDVESASEVSVPALVEVDTQDELFAESVESLSETTNPTLGQVHALLAEDIESACTITTPVLSINPAMLRFQSVVKPVTWRSFARP